MASSNRSILSIYFLLLVSTLHITTNSSLQLFPLQPKDGPAHAFTEHQHRHRHRHGYGTGSLDDSDDPEGVKARAIRRLLEVFGIHPPDDRNGVRGSRSAYEPPQYMVDLYNSIADSGGVSKRRNPYDANIIRSFPDKDSAHHFLFSFNVSGVERAENILQAELHVYKMRPNKGLQSSVPMHQSDPHSHLLEMRVYQVLERSKENQEDGNRLLDARRISALSVGWEVFRVKAAVLDWIRNETTNKGLLLTLRTVSGERVNDSNIVRIAKRHRHSNKQPILVIFSSDDRTRYDQTISTTSSAASSRVTWYPTTVQSSAGSDLPEDGNNQRPIRSASASASVSRPRPTVTPLIEMTSNGTPTSSSSSTSNSSASSGSGSMASGQECTRHELLVDFQQIGWAGWIISPKEYNAYYCKGTCGYPLGQNQRPTNHATVQSIVHELKLHTDVGTPSCVPNKLNSISLLFFENDSVVLRQYDEMVAASCGCH